jgi:hypothetical protein
VAVRAILVKKNDSGRPTLPGSSYLLLAERGLQTTVRSSIVWPFSYTQHPLIQGENFVFLQHCGCLHKYMLFGFRCLSYCPDTMYFCLGLNSAVELTPTSAPHHPTPHHKP